MSVKLTTITEDEAKSFIQVLVGREVTHVWRGYGTAIFIEIGKLIKKEDRKNPDGEFTIAIEGTWRVEEGNEIIIGTDEDDAKLNKIFTIFKNLEVTNLNFFARLKEIEIEFNKDLWLSSFEMIGGDPQWSIKNDKTWLYYKSNKFVLEEVL